MDNLQAIAVIIGIVNGIRLLQAQNKWGFIFFCCAVGVGLILGALHFFGLSIETGLVAALASSGLYRVGEKVGGQ
jgi:uncharacterized membrane protein